MKRNTPLLVLVCVSLLQTGCPFFDGDIFPVWPANFFDTPPAELGSFSVNSSRVDQPNGADGAPFGISVFAPEGATEPLPAFIWVLGSNARDYYHQSLHETLASWGYVVIVPDTRPLTFTDFQYHRRNMDLARQALAMARAGDLGVAVDPDRIGIGGYSIGGTMAAMVAAEEPALGAIVVWAPTGAPFWTGANPDQLLPAVSAPALFLLAEFDHVEPPSGFPQVMQAQMSQSAITEIVIPQGLHLYFQQPTGADSPTDPMSELTRFEQQGIAIDATRDFLDEQLAGGS